MFVHTLWRKITTVVELRSMEPLANQLHRVSTIILFLACTQRLAAIGYPELLDMAMAADESLKRLNFALERAQISGEQVDLLRRTPEFQIRTGSVTGSLESGKLTLSASPSATIEFSDGASIGTDVELTSSSSGLYAAGSASLGIPLLHGADEKELSVLDARNAYALALAASIRRRFELELGLDQALATAFQAEVSLRSAERTQASAQRDLERAVTIDGAEPGGATYSTLSRALRSATRSKRDAQLTKVKSIAALRRIVAVPAGRIPDADLLPSTFAVVQLGELPVTTEETYAVAAAKAALTLGIQKAREREKRTTLSTKVGASYGFVSAASAAETSSEDEEVGIGISTGLGAELGRSGLTIDGGLGWQEGSGASASLSLSWAPKPRGYESLGDADKRLELDMLELGVQEARTAAATDIEDLAEARTILKETLAEATEDLILAEAELTAYRQGKDSGMVTETDYEETLAVRDECVARVLSAKLERVAWNVRAALLVAGSEAFGDEK